MLGSGGIKCIASIGLLKVLHRRQLTPDVIVGCSGGSLFGAAYATGESPEQIEALVLKMWQKKEFRDFTYGTLLKMFVPKFFRINESFGLIKGGRIEKIFNAYFQGQTIEHTKIPLQLVSTDFFTGETVVMDTGSITEAIRASISIPIFFQPKRINGKVLIDGAVSDPLPVDVAIKYGADIIIAMGFENPTYTQIRSPADLLFHLTALYNNNLMIANHAIHNMAHHYEIILICPPIPNTINFFDVARIPDLIKIGEEAAEQDFPNIQYAIDHFTG